MVFRGFLLSCGVLPIAMLALLAAGCTTPRSPASDQTRIRQARSEMIARGDADSLATAAFLTRLATGSWRDAPPLAGRAMAMAPKRADLAYLGLLICHQQPSCPSQPYEERLRELDPANGVVWLFALRRARQDGSAMNAALTGLAQAQRVDLYWTALVSHMTAALAAGARFEQGAAFEYVVGIDAAMVIPPVQPVSTSCSAAAITQADVLVRCRGIAAAFEQADTILFESYGNHLAARLWPSDSAQGTALAAQRRLLDQRMAQWSRDELNTPQAIRTLAALYGQNPTEQAAQVAWYAAEGIP